VGSFPTELFSGMGNVGQLKCQLGYRFSKLSAFLRAIVCRRELQPTGRRAHSLCTISQIYKKKLKYNDSNTILKMI
jgi:hypothetical protein